MPQFPWRFQLAGQTFFLHAIFELLAFFIGFRYHVWLRKQQGDHIDSNHRTWIIIGAIFGALIGSRLVGGMESVIQLKKSSNILLHFYANKSVVGGFFGGVLGVEFIKKLVGEKQRSGDLFVYPILLALIIGRIGCFSMGVHEDVFGISTPFFTGINLGDGIKRHPLMLYEIAFLAVFWCMIVWVKNRLSPLRGESFKLLMVGYFGFRFCIEFLKSSEHYFAGLGAIQLTCLTGLIYYADYIILIFKRTFQPAIQPEPIQ